MFYFAAGVAAQIVKYPRYEFLIIWLFHDQTAGILIRPVYISFSMYVIVLHRPIKQLQKLQNIPVERSVIKIKNKSCKYIYETDPSDHTRREEFRRNKLKTLAPYGLNVEEWLLMSSLG